MVPIGSAKFWNRLRRNAWVLLGKKGSGLHQHKLFENPFKWSSSTIWSILEKREYLGHMMDFKFCKSRYKDMRNRYLPESEWFIFENTHEAIIDI
jgi:hypothetical protein